MTPPPDHDFVGGYTIDPSQCTTCQVCARHVDEHGPRRERRSRGAAPASPPSIPCIFCRILGRATPCPQNHRKATLRTGGVQHFETDTQVIAREAIAAGRSLTERGTTMTNDKTPGDPDDDAARDRARWAQQDAGLVPSWDAEERAAMRQDLEDRDNWNRRAS